MTSGAREPRGVWQSLPWSLRYAAVAGACTLIIVAVGYLALQLAVLVAPLTLAIIVALLLTALLQPLTEFVSRWVPRMVGALLGVLVLLGAIIGPGVLLWRATAPQAAELAAELAEGWGRIRDWLIDTFGISTEQIDAVIAEGTEWLQSAAPNLAAYTMTAVEAVGAALLALVLVFLFLKDGPKMAAWLRRLLPERSGPKWSRAATRGWHALGQYARGQVTVAAVDAVGIGVALFIIGVPLALPLAVLTFVAAFVPILGATVAGAVAVLVALAANGPVDALLVLGAVILVQQAEGNLLEPIIMGRALRLHPAVVLVAVTGGALTAGVAGALVAVPVTAVGYRIIRTVLTEDAEDPDTDGSDPPDDSADDPEPRDADGSTQPAASAQPDGSAQPGASAQPGRPAQPGASAQTDRSAQPEHAAIQPDADGDDLGAPGVAARPAG